MRVPEQDIIDKMKRIVLLAAVLAALTGCSGDYDATDPELGQYLYETDNLTIDIDVYDSNTSVAIYVDGECKYQYLSGTKTGDKESYTYRYDKLALACVYTTAKAFTATVAANGTGITLPAEMDFKYSDKTLDGDGDGLLDGWQ